MSLWYDHCFFIVHNILLFICKGRWDCYKLVPAHGFILPIALMLYITWTSMKIYKEGVIAITDMIFGTIAFLAIVVFYIVL
jgi:hypothetical protein